MENKEYHANGNLAYIETIKTISEAEYKTGKYPNCRVSDNGVIWVRVGLNAKYHANGIMAWGMQYDDYGSLTQLHPSKRKDGTLIII